MADARLAAYAARLATRGLTINRFDGFTLYLDYDMQNDSEIKAKRPVESSSLSDFATDAMNEQFPGPEIFPGLRNINIAY
ncbi:MAG: hypothetical protein JWM87_707 [Candidatus Eremiobacteraeota bacterium]|nr:hypothetical protein [Candidatus Eremiobacteraeota bacterium]